MIDKPKLCPMQLAGGRNADCAPCYGSACTWWDAQSKSCCMASHADYTRANSGYLDEIGVSIYNLKE